MEDSKTEFIRHIAGMALPDESEKQPLERRGRPWKDNRVVRLVLIQLILDARQL